MFEKSIIYVELIAYPTDVLIVQVYVPTSDHDDHKFREYMTK